MNLEVELGRIRGALWRVLAVRLLTRYLSVWVFVWGGALLALRWLGVAWEGAAAGGGLVLLALVAAACEVARRQLPARARLVAWLDSRSGGSGLLLAREQGLLPASAAMPEHTDPALVSWEDRRPAAILTLGVLFLAGAMFAPLPSTSQASSFTPGPELLQQLAEKVEVLAQHELADLADLNHTRRELADLTEADPASALDFWSAYDRVEDSLAEIAREAVDETLAASRELAAAQTLAQAMADFSMREESQLAEHAQQDLTEMLKGLEHLGGLPESLPEELKQALEGKKPLTEQQLEQLKETMSQQQESLRKQMEKLAEQKMCEQKQAQQCKSPNSQAGEQLAEAIRRHYQKHGQCKQMIMSRAFQDQRQAPGTSSGDPRGGGQAPLDFSGNTDESQMSYLDEMVEGTHSDLSQSMVFHTLLAEPKPADDAEAPSQVLGVSADNPSQSGGVTHRIPPRHRNAVSRFFHQPASGKKADQPTQPTPREP